MNKKLIVAILTVPLLGLASTAQASPGTTVDTPANAVACGPVPLTWTGGASPYDVSVVDPSGALLEDLGSQSGNAYTWPKADVAAGTEVKVKVQDSNGASAESVSFTIQPGSDTSCLSSAE